VQTDEGRARAKANGKSLGRPHKLTLHQRQEAIRRRENGEPVRTSLAQRGDPGGPHDQLARDGNARRVDHMGLDALSLQPSRQPEAIPAGLVGHRDPIARARPVDAPEPAPAEAGGTIVRCHDHCCAALDVNAGEKMHRRAGVKMHHGRMGEGGLRIARLITSAPK
jgi:hypothetical protein